MKRREFIMFLSSATVYPTITTGAQESRRYVLGVLNAQGREAPNFPPFFDELRRLGFVEGENLIVDGRGYAARTEQFSALAQELAKVKVDAIVSGGPAATRAAQQATKTIPILAVLDDMVEAGIVPSLARPGGNTTGISFLASELDGKRQELLMELVPGARRMVALVDANATAAQRVQKLEAAARLRGVELTSMLINRPERIGAAVEEAHRSGAKALNVLASPLLNARRAELFELAIVLRLPAIYQWPESAEEGGLIGYGPSIAQIYRQLARQVNKVFRGARPDDLPVEQPTSFELVVNTRAAKLIGLDVPASLALRADRLID